jgi:tol-pal system-associated acyl-CoA thioesterase
MSHVLPHIHPVQIYYEDTDHSGVVYHANYLKYFERAREHLLGPAELVRMLRADGIGFVVYRAELTFRGGAVFGDSIEVRTTVQRESDYRLGFTHDVYRGDELLVQGKVELVTVNAQRELVPLPDTIARTLSPP